MDLALPHLADVRVDSANQELLKDLDQLKATIDAARPLDAAVISRLKNELLADQVYSSNSMEGNSLSLRETQAILASGQIVGVGKQRDRLEALNLGNAIDAMAHSLAAEQTSFTDLRRFQDVHRILFTEIDNDAAGAFRSVRVQIQGARRQPPREFQQSLTQMFDELKHLNARHPVVAAAWAHWAIARLHPFVDGNGRMARLWQDYILPAHQYTPAIIPHSQRKAYYSALEHADDGDLTELIQLVIQSAIATSQMYVNAIRAADEVGDWAEELVGESVQLVDDKHRLEYGRWRSRVTELRDAFQRCLALLARKSTRMDFDLHSYDIIDIATWKSLRSEPHAPQTWCFRIVANGDAGRFQYVFFAGKHVRTAPLDDVLPVGRSQVSLLVSEKCGTADSAILRDDCSPVSLREVLVADGEFLRKRWDAETRSLIYDRNLTALQIAQDFLTEVVKHRLVG